MGSENDLQVIEALRHGEGWAVECLDRRYRAELESVVRRRVRLALPDAQDAVAAIFAELSQPDSRLVANLLRLRGSIRSYLIGAALHKGLDILRARSPKSLQELQLEPDEWERVAERPDPAGTPQARVEEAEDTARMRSALSELTPRQRQVVELRVDTGAGFSEIARTMGVSIGRATGLFAEAVARLRSKLAS
jgi:RNA polymerase sigma-70 factor, ECF subfamily